jgi:hypothetical protein
MFRGLALKLSYSGIPAVGTLQYPMENSLAIIFIRGFYTSLNKGMPIDIAAQRGRIEISDFLSDNKLIRNASAFGSSVIYMQGPDTIIVE